VTTDVTPCPKPVGFDGGDKEHLNVVVALDAFGSMAGHVPRGQKMKIAKDAVTRFIIILPERARIGLVVYGYKGSNAKRQRQVSCEGVEVLYPLQPDLDL
jgi:Ca-activated chloride channel family protein